MMAEESYINFYVTVTGTVECANFKGGISDEELYLRYDIVCGDDWEVLTGLTGAISQLASTGINPERVVFNIPMEVNLKSSTISGWPQIVVSVYGLSKFGLEGVRGYGRTHIPTTVGQHVLDVNLSCPRSSTWLGDWLAWFTGRNPELVSPSILADGKENLLMQTQSYGTVTIKLSIVTKNLHKLGFDNVAA